MGKTDRNYRIRKRSLEREKEEEDEDVERIKFFISFFANLNTL